MSSIDLIRMGLQNLWRRKLRTFLTILGVIIGTSSIVVMLSLGFGMNKSMEDMISEFGSLTTINVRKPWDQAPGSKPVPLDDKAIIKFKELDNVLAVSPVVQTYVKLTHKNLETSVDLRGIDPDAMEAFEYVAADGRLLNGSDKLSVVYGAEVGKRFYNPKAKVWKEYDIDPMSDKISMVFEVYDSNTGDSKQKEYKVRPAGVLEPGGWEKDSSIFMPLKEVEKLMKENTSENQSGNQSGQNKKKKGYDQIDVKINNIENVQVAQQTIKDMGYEAYSLNDQLDAFKQQSKIMQAILGGIGAISLLVAAIGITNTMIMSIYERTKEIGVMKVIGASIKDIKRLFLLESAAIGLLGGVFGVTLSYGLSYLLNHLAGSFLGGAEAGMGSKISIIPIWLALAAMAFSALIGIISGYFPARRAMNLSALEAIRTE